MDVRNRKKKKNNARGKKGAKELISPRGLQPRVDVYVRLGAHTHFF